MYINKSLKILNSREKKEINDRVKSQWGAEFSKEYAFLINTKKRVYLVNHEIDQLDFSRIKIDKLGLYVCHVSEKGVRLTIEGSQIIGPKATQNIVEISDKDLESWFKGEDLKKLPEKNENNFVILKHETDFVGCGKITEKGILNFIPKVRRVVNNLNI